MEAVRYVSEARGSGSEAPWNFVGSASEVRDPRFFDFHGGFWGDESCELVTFVLPFDKRLVIAPPRVSPKSLTNERTATPEPP